MIYGDNIQPIQQQQISIDPTPVCQWLGITVPSFFCQNPLLSLGILIFAGIYLIRNI